MKNSLLVLLIYQSNMMKRLVTICFMLVVLVANAQKPKVWVISDGGDGINDPDDISAIASYLLMSNLFDTRAIVMASTVHAWNKETSDQGIWASEFFGKAYSSDLPNLKKHIGGYQSDFRFIESSIKGQGNNFDPKEDVNLKDYPSILALYKEVKKSKEIINVLCWGPLTEQALFVKYCLDQNKHNVLSKVRFISHWSSSNYHTGTMENPELTHNCVGDPIACDYMKVQALNGLIKFYECGAIGQFGIVENAQKGSDYYDQFKASHLGKIFAEGKFKKERVDDSDCATYWVLIGDYGVSLDDLAGNGLNMPEVEKRNEEAFASHAELIRHEILRRSNAAAGKVDAIESDYYIAPRGRIERK
ncbi:nucleoside hydrolase-like domain-containing protein [Reichenbachiella versicolor]|uniref:nucleoside hydrolase-like domain-containing protein n=1 Tax=Reichenbachiella versicolor TaxID=1821036 RepID=UPI000D6E0102|nr:nucleoside hydrolase-like domain-containing protein [Reichenbachiella versicolor]